MLIIIGCGIIYFYSKTSTIFNIGKNEVYTETTSCYRESSSRYGRISDLIGI